MPGKWFKPSLRSAKPVPFGKQNKSQALSTYNILKFTILDFKKAVMIIHYPRCLRTLKGVA
jgi:hypothetical protein